MRARGRVRAAAFLSVCGFSVVDAANEVVEEEDEEEEEEEEEDEEEDLLGL